MKLHYLLLLVLLISPNLHAQTTAQEWFDKGEHSDDYTEKVRCYTKAIELGYNPLYQAYHSRGFAKDDLGQYKEAILDYDKAIQLNPNHTNAYNNRGFAKRKLGRYKEAILDYNKAIQLNPNYANAYHNRGFAKRKLGKYKEAILDYDKAIQLSPNFENAYHNRGFAKRKLGKYKEAIQDYNKTIELNPTDPDTYYNRGHIKKELGNYQEAIQDFSLSIKYCNNDCEYKYNQRGYCYFKLGEYEKAIADWESMKSIDPNHYPEHDYIDGARQKLEEQNAAPQTVRLALLIGNANYKGEAKLNNPIHDATDIEKELTNYGFESTMLKNLDLQGIDNAVSSFADKIDRYKAQGYHVTALMYYSGHGLQHNNANYLIPIGFSINRATDIPYKSYLDKRLLDHLSEAHTQIVMIDACRSKAKMKGMFRDLPFEEGLLPPSTTPSLPTADNVDHFNEMCQGTFISYAAAPGTKARDGKGRNSPYVMSFLKVLRNNNTLEIRRLFSELKKELFRSTQGQQRSWSNDDLINDFYFTTN
ncbi:MAG: tetratricopeptide repeat protein [Flammeovirgaceae bacterium]